MLHVEIGALDIAAELSQSLVHFFEVEVRFEDLPDFLTQVEGSDRSLEKLPDCFVLRIWRLELFRCGVVETAFTQYQKLELQRS